jgi:alpha-ketoglutarate-dependent taurine dioxygenase
MICFAIWHCYVCQVPITTYLPTILYPAAEHCRTRRLGIRLIGTVGRRGVIFFRNQHNINDTLQKQLCRRLNELSGAPKENGFYRHSLLSMQGEDPEMGKVDPDRIYKMYQKPLNGLPRQSHVKEWHTDSSFEAMPPSYTALRLAEMPETGGGT